MRDIGEQGIRRPSTYKFVILSNTVHPPRLATSDQVAGLLTRTFNMQEEEASKQGRDLFYRQIAQFGAYPLDIIETKLIPLNAVCRRMGLPVTFTYEIVSGPR